MLRSINLFQKIKNTFKYTALSCTLITGTATIYYRQSPYLDTGWWVYSEYRKQKINSTFWEKYNLPQSQNSALVCYETEENSAIEKIFQTIARVCIVGFVKVVGFFIFRVLNKLYIKKDANWNYTNEIISQQGATPLLTVSNHITVFDDPFLLCQIFPDASGSTISSFVSLTKSILEQNINWSKDNDIFLNLQVNHLQNKTSSDLISNTGYVPNTNSNITEHTDLINNTTQNLKISSSDLRNKNESNCKINQSNFNEITDSKYSNLNFESLYNAYRSLLHISLTFMILLFNEPKEITRRNIHLKWNSATSLCHTINCSNKLFFGIPQYDYTIFFIGYNILRPVGLSYSYFSLYGLNNTEIFKPSLKPRTLPRFGACAQDICYSNPLMSGFATLGCAVPLNRGAGLNQPGITYLARALNRGEWVHFFPEGKVNSCGSKPYNNYPLRWGVGELIRLSSRSVVLIPIKLKGADKIISQSEIKTNKNIGFGHRVDIKVGPALKYDIDELSESEYRKKIVEIIKPWILNDF